MCHRFRDAEKRRISERVGITLIDIPFWWDNKLPSLQATVHKYRPDVVPDPGDGVPVDLSVPAKYQQPESIRLRFVL